MLNQQRTFELIDSFNNTDTLSLLTNFNQLLIEDEQNINNKNTNNKFSIRM